jgi:hypothetical protein
VLLCVLQSLHWLTPVLRYVDWRLHAQLPDQIVKHQGVGFFT